MATITFLGAAQEVTGSCHLVHSSQLGKVLLDCGMQQGGDDVDKYHQQGFGFNPSEIDAVILSHAHLDHSGMLPKLARNGFNGIIYLTHASKALLHILLKDAASLYLKDLERENIRRARKGKSLLEPEFTAADVEIVMGLCQSYDYQEPISLGKSGVIKFIDAGHILGSAIVELAITEQGQRKVLVFSGDLGNPDSVLMKDPSPVYHQMY